MTQQCDEHGIVGVNDDEGPPVPIPNTVVKLIRAEDTWLEAARENRSMPTQTRAVEFQQSFIFICASVAQSVRASDC